MASESFAALNVQMEATIQPLKLATLGILCNTRILIDHFTFVLLLTGILFACFL